MYPHAESGSADGNSRCADGLPRRGEFAVSPATNAVSAAANLATTADSGHGLGVSVCDDHCVGW